jgi:hypothetical protein
LTLKDKENRSPLIRAVYQTREIKQPFQFNQQTMYRGNLGFGDSVLETDAAMSITDEQDEPPMIILKKV